MKRGLSILTLAVLAASLTACGGGSHSTTSTTKQTTTTTKKKTVVAPAARVLTAGARIVGGATTFAPSVTVKPSDRIFVRIAPPPSRTGVPVALTFATGPKRSLTVTAKANGQTAKVKVLGAGNQHVTLSDIGYGCSLPPLPSICPPKHVHTTSTSATATFTTHGALLVSALVGPVTTPTFRTPPVISAVVAPYAVTELVSAVTPPSQAGGKPTATVPAPTATVKPGQTLFLSTHLRAHVAGAPQTITVTINQGPGNTIAITASVPGGQTATATVKSATGAKIALVSPRFNCALPPGRTFCPPSKTVVQSRKYALSFPASPATPPIVLLATVQAA